MANGNKLISFDLTGDFGFFKKPDYNDGILLSYNMLHKPALLGILGAIIGLKGYERKGEFPEYHLRLKDLPVGIEPLENSHERGSFQKTTVKYSNTVGYANADGNLLIEEVMLIKPAYRCYLLLDLSNPDHSHLYTNLKEGKAEYIPYLGKNEFQAWWLDENGESTFQEYEFERRKADSGSFQVSTMINKRKVILKDEIVDDDFCDNYNPFEITFKADTFMYFERLPVGFNAELFQYEICDFTLSNFPLKPNTALDNLYFLAALDYYVQLS
ncbi:CRISPR-associated protein Cas5 [Dyadobacter sp. LHD-138]|uniref:CRISPR-associated protein Cas5 n=1 Tax=Dyadobacter sp. LHD-138 TaxID=3071413 RepID=UPI0027E0D960|nr:CRISPR-associated protein Cas5 [Dyadobacter sp. LHD-138]MDQ6477256.1 CRISPR-associated protein Cas5 [Dyadobacter sp. LHD-138]